MSKESCGNYIMDINETEKSCMYSGHYTTMEDHGDYVAVVNELSGEKKKIASRGTVQYFAEALWE